MLNKKIIRNTVGIFSLLVSTSAITVCADTIKLKPNHDYLVTETRPNDIVVVDLKTKQVVNDCKIDEVFSPGGVILSNDYKTAYIIGGFGAEIAGYNIETCKKVFYTSLTQGDVRASTLSGIAVSEDDKKVYAIYNRTKIGSDRYTVLDSMFSVFNAADGLKAKSIKDFTIPRQMTMISTALDGTVYGVGSAMYAINPKTGDMKVAQKIVGWGKPGFSDPDSAANYLIGQQTNELTALYATVKYKDPNVPDEDEGTWYWGITSVDLKTKEITQVEFTEYETLMFTAIKSPTDPNILYGSLNDLTKFDIKNQAVIKRVVNDHTYYSVVPSMDGKTLYLGGCLNDIAIYDADTLDKIGKIYLPGDMGSAALQVFHTK